MASDQGRKRREFSEGEQIIGRRTPERLIGGFSRRDSTFLFYSLIHSVLEPHFRVLDFGAGRGAQGENEWPAKRKLLTLKGKVQWVAGVDVDPVVLSNPLLDEAHVFDPDKGLPFADESFDLIYSDWVIEHVDDVERFSSEVHRVLKPGGWFFGRTPNKLGLIALSATLVPNSLHKRVLKTLQPERESKDVFPTRYRLNTPSAVRRWFRPERWENYTTTIDTEFMYLARNAILFEIVERVGRILPSAFRPVLIVSLRKHEF
ncbi:class I SAM-dependent methyltransferase [Brevundimonas sp.]|uniref:class I SAM-dependent methyltransferase n=1 Tax=Brevundimonas sp. TaxID=1871086 RepID=UPI003BA91B03